MNSAQEVKAGVVCIAYSAEIKKRGESTLHRESRPKQKRCIRQFLCYNLRAKKHFVHNVYGRGREGYGVSGIGEIPN